MITPWPTHAWESQTTDYFSLSSATVIKQSKTTLWGRGPTSGKSGQELESGTWRQELKQRPWRNTVSWLSQLPFFLSLGPPAQGGAVGWVFPESNNNQENLPGHADKGNLSVDVPSSRVCQCDNQDYPVTVTYCRLLFGVARRVINSRNNKNLMLS